MTLNDMAASPNAGIATMSKTILLIHGAWLTSAIWQPWITRYEAQGYEVLAPASANQV